jgi:hypothetical protein
MAIVLYSFFVRIALNKNIIQIIENANVKAPNEIFTNFSSRDFIS